MWRLAQACAITATGHALYRACSRNVLHVEVEPEMKLFTRALEYRWPKEHGEPERKKTAMEPAGWGTRRLEKNAETVNERHTKPMRLCNRRMPATRTGAQRVWVVTGP